MRKPPTALMASISAGALFMEMFDGTVILTALPAMAADFGVSPLAMGVGITGYLLALAAVLPASGWIADRFGTRRVFMSAVSVFALASLACALSRTLPQFTAARVLQGAAGALMSPVARIALLKVLDRPTMVRAMNIGIMVGLMGPTLGPAVGGFFATYSDWQWIFLINLPIALLALLAVHGRYPDVREAEPREFDWRGAGLNAAALIGIVYGLQLLSDSRHDWRAGLSLTLAGLVVAWLAVRHARRHAHPLLAMTAFRIQTFHASAVAGFISRMAILGTVFVLPLLLQLGLGMSAFLAGVYMLVAAGSDVLAKLAIVPALRRHGHRAVLLGSSVLYAAFPLLLAAVTGDTPAALLLALMVYGGVVRSFHMTAINTLSFTDVPQAEVSSASTVISVVQQLAQAIGVALAAVVVHLAVLARTGGEATMQRGDFQAVLLLLTLASLSALYWFRRLPVDAGHQASGFRPRR